MIHPRRAGRTRPIAPAGSFKHQPSKLAEAQSSSPSKKFYRPKVNSAAIRLSGRPNSVILPSSLSLLLLFWLTLTLTLLSPEQLATAFCPLKCQCDDQNLSANCTQTPSLSIVPMTLNPLLKRLTLNHLQVVELSSSLSVYRQLEYLNLNSNQLRQIRYSNFNFISAPHSVTLMRPDEQGLESAKQAEQLARSMKNAIERGFALASALANSDGLTQQPTGEDQQQSTSGGSEFFGLQLRELHLGDNRIEQLGDLQARPSFNQDLSQNGEKRRKLKAAELERSAPFLSLTRLELLDLSGNRLTRLEEHAFLGLIRLKRLDLFRNQLEFLDRHALVGLIELRSLNLAQNALFVHHPIAHFGLALCRGPLMELRQLDLSENSDAEQLGSTSEEFSFPTATATPASDDGGARMKHILPNRLFSCTPKLSEIHLSALKLRHIQVNTLDNLNGLQLLNLSSNPLEQVPSDLLQTPPATAAQVNQFNYYPSTLPSNNLSASLHELDLSNTLIEFVSLKSSNSFGHLRSLEKLRLNRMPRLVSFDVAALATSLDSHTLPLNEHLQELHLSDNHRLQSFHSSLALTSLGNQQSRVKFGQLRLIDLSGATELRELSSPAKMLELEKGPPGPPVRLRLAHVSSLNCSSCQMGWLVESIRRQVRVATGWPGRPALQRQPAPTSMVPFDPYNSYAHPVRQQPAELQAHSELAAQFELIQPELIGCSWPYSMPLIELINLENSNYAPLFPQPSQCLAGQAQQERSREASLQQLQQQQKLHQGLAAFPHATATSPSAATPTGSTTMGSDGAQSPGGSLVVGALLLGLLVVFGARLVVLLLLRKRQGRQMNLWNRSPSLTASSTIVSPSSTSSSNTSGQAQAQAQAQAQTQPQPQPPALLALTFANGKNGLVCALPAPPQDQQQQQQQRQHHQYGINNSYNLDEIKKNFQLELERKRRRNQQGDQTQKTSGARVGGNLFSRFVARLSGRRAGRHREHQRQSCSARNWDHPVDGVRIFVDPTRAAVGGCQFEARGDGSGVLGASERRVPAATTSRGQLERFHYNIREGPQQQQAAYESIAAMAGDALGNIYESTAELQPVDVDGAGFIYANCEPQLRRLHHDYSMGRSSTLTSSPPCPPRPPPAANCAPASAALGARSSGQPIGAQRQAPIDSRELQQQTTGTRALPLPGPPDAAALPVGDEPNWWRHQPERRLNGGEPRQLERRRQLEATGSGEQGGGGGGRGQATGTCRQQHLQPRAGQSEAGEQNHFAASRPIGAEASHWQPPLTSCYADHNLHPAKRPVEGGQVRDKGPSPAYVTPDEPISQRTHEVAQSGALGAPLGVPLLVSDQRAGRTDKFKLLSTIATDRKCASPEEARAESARDEPRLRVGSSNPPSDGPRHASRAPDGPFGAMIPIQAATAGVGPQLSPMAYANASRAHNQPNEGELNDYLVINGLRCSEGDAQSASSASDWKNGQMVARTSNGHCGNVYAGQNLINQQQPSSLPLVEQKQQPHKGRPQPAADGGDLASDETIVCSDDFAILTRQRAADQLVATGETGLHKQKSKQRSKTLNRNSNRAAAPTAEIYSNQFYYCKSRPSETKRVGGDSDSGHLV